MNKNQMIFSLCLIFILDAQHSCSMEDNRTYSPDEIAAADLGSSIIEYAQNTGAFQQSIQYLQDHFNNPRTLTTDPKTWASPENHAARMAAYCQLHCKANKDHRKDIIDLIQHGIISQPPN